jgi:hypothetical protein
LAVAGASVATSGIFGVLAARAYSDFQNTNLERQSIAARDRYQAYGVTAISAAAVGVLSGALGYWLWNRDNPSSASPQ